MGRKGIQLAAGLVIILGGLVALAGVSFKQNLVYYLTVSEYLERTGPLPPQGFRLNGNVVKGSIQRATEGIGVRFEITDGKRTIPVSYNRELPDTFREGAEVVVEGASDAQGTFAAKTLLAKCPSKYEKQGTEHPEGVPMEAPPTTTL